MLNQNIDFTEGAVIPVNKPYGWTSLDVVRKIRVMLRWIGLRKIKVGHAGTLDPLATGVLLLCIGKATKLADSLQAEKKSYVAEIELGATTPSYDMEHEIDKTYPYLHISEKMVKEVLTRFKGEMEQLPPMYSAKQISGKRAYEYAREGVDIELKKAKITIYDINLLEFSLPRIKIMISCSKGTYIRSLARDIGEALGSGGYLKGLTRISSGEFDIDKCYEIDYLEKYFISLKDLYNN